MHKSKSNSKVNHQQNIKIVILRRVMAILLPTKSDNIKQHYQKNDQKNDYRIKQKNKGNQLKKVGPGAQAPWN